MTGIFSGGKRPFGFDVVKEGDVQRMVPNAAEQAVIERMKAKTPVKSKSG